MYQEAKQNGCIALIACLQALMIKNVTSRNVLDEGANVLAQCVLAFGLECRLEQLRGPKVPPFPHHNLSRLCSKAILLAIFTLDLVVENGLALLILPVVPFAKCDTTFDQIESKNMDERISTQYACVLGEPNWTE
jgi:hypothetical protein